MNEKNKHNTYTNDFFKPGFISTEALDNLIKDLKEAEIRRNYFNAQKVEYKIVDTKLLPPAPNEK